jgi:hypothetical protein
VPHDVREQVKNVTYIYKNLYLKLVQICFSPHQAVSNQPNFVWMQQQQQQMQQQQQSEDYAKPVSILIDGNEMSH